MLVSKSIASSFTLFARRESISTGLTPATAVERYLQQTFTYDNVKRSIDILVASCLLICLSPLLLFIAFIVALTSRGPVVFKQKRLTSGGKIFTMYKFRTMQANAEEHTGAVWASAYDPRVTRIGRFLRLSRLDELPQLVNVLNGDMSLIGPRPERPEIAAELEKEIPLFRRRIEVKAGITGLAQIAQGYAACMGTYKTKIAFDIEYVENRSFLLDLNIAWKTLKVILTGAGAR